MKCRTYLLIIVFCLVPFPLPSCHGQSRGIIGGDVGDMPDPCSPSSSDKQIMEKIFGSCLDSDSAPEHTDTADERACEQRAGCVAAALSDISYCDKDELDDLVCNRATVAFVLVESTRRLLAAASVTLPTNSRTAAVPNDLCENITKLKRLSSVCRQSDPLIEVGDRPMSSGGLMGEDSGVDGLVRATSVLLGRMDAVQHDMKQLKHRRLMQGTVAIVLTFALPGLMALFSQMHVRTVTGLQCMSLLLVFYYVLQQHGLGHACAVSFACGLVLVLEMFLLALMAKYTSIHEHNI